MAALVERDEAVVAGLLEKLRNPATSLPSKYRILFSLRGIAGETAHAAMLEGGWVRCLGLRAVLLLTTPLSPACLPA